MNDDDIDFLEREHLVPRSDMGHGSDEGKTIIADDSGHILSDLDALAELRDKLAGKFDGHEVLSAMHKGTKDIVGSIKDVAIGGERLGRSIFDSADVDDIFRPAHERKTLIQSYQKISALEFSHIPEDRREAFLDTIKEKALYGMLEQADLIGAVSYEEGTDPITYEKIIVTKLKVIKDD